MKKLRTALLLLLLSSAVQAQKLAPKKRIPEPDHIIQSKITNHAYQLYISFPSKYSTQDTVLHPVLYVLDGLYYNQTLDQTRIVMDWANMLEDVIIVSISSGSNFEEWFIARTADYTPSASTTNEAALTKNYAFGTGKLKSGQAEKFLASIKQEISPFIDKHYKTNADRGIAGHSFGGLFAAYCLIHSPEYFSRYGINSPSLWWDNQKLLLESKAVLDKYPSLKARVFISAGEKEGKSMVSAAEQLANDLKVRIQQGLTVEWQLFEKENHFSVAPATFSRTLKVLYGK